MYGSRPYLFFGQLSVLLNFNCWLQSILLVLSNVASIFSGFISTVENLCNAKSKYLQSDAGGEFIGKGLQVLFTKLDIIHRPEQNGLAKCKHRHIVEIGLTLLAHSHLDSWFWNHAFSTTVYLINRMFTSVLNFKSPFEVFLGTPPDYSLLPIFRSLCYLCLTPFDRTKRQFKCRQCVLLGYKPIHKGYKCYDPHINKIILSHHIFFNESHFFAPSPTSPASLTSPFTFRPFPNILQFPSSDSQQTASPSNVTLHPHNLPPLMVNPPLRAPPLFDTTPARLVSSFANSHVPAVASTLTQVPSAVPMVIPSISPPPHTGA